MSEDQIRVLIAKIDGEIAARKGHTRQTIERWVSAYADEYSKWIEPLIDEE